MSESHVLKRHSVRPFLTKLGNAVALMLISLFYLLTGARQATTARVR